MKRCTICSALAILIAGCHDEVGDTAAPIALSDGSIVFVDATLIPSGEVADVVVTGSLIDAILPRGGDYTGGEIIDAGGRFLAPGLADLHVHLWYEGDLWLYLANGVTTVRNLFGDEVHLDWRAEIESGALAGPTLWTSGPIIDGPDPYWWGSDTAADADEGRAVAEAQIAAGYDMLKVYDSVPADAWAAMIEVADAAGVPVVGHVPNDVGYRAVADGGQRTIEHLDGALAEALGEDPFSSFDLSAAQAGLAALTDDMAAQIAADSAAVGVWNVPTHVVWESLGRADEWDFDDPRLAYVHPDVAASWSQTWSYFQQSGTAAAYYADYAAALCPFTAAMSDAGAPLALGTDVINPFIFPGWSVHEELASLVACGLEPDQALALATTAAAEAMGQPGEFGVVAEGARADLLLLDADPRQDLAALQEPAGVMARGQWWTADDLDAALQSVADGYAGR